MNQTTTTDIATLVAQFVTAATAELPKSPAEVIRPLRREAQAKFNVDGLPRGLADVA